MKNTISLSLFLAACAHLAHSQASGLVVKDETLSVHYYRNEVVSVDAVNEGDQEIRIYYFLEVWFDNRWNPWDYGSLSGQYMEIAQEYVLRKGQSISMPFTLKNLSPTPPPPEGHVIECDLKSKFRYRVVQKFNGKEKSIYSAPFYIYGRKILVQGVPVNLDPICDK